MKTIKTYLNPAVFVIFLMGRPKKNSIIIKDTKIKGAKKITVFSGISYNSNIFNISYNSSLKARDCDVTNHLTPLIRPVISVISAEPMKIVFSSMSSMFSMFSSKNLEGCDNGI